MKPMLKAVRDHSGNEAQTRACTERKEEQADDAYSADCHAAYI
jgi:hypothetical protein